MKESQLIEKMKEVETRLKESKIVEKCYQAVTQYGEGHTEVARFHTHHDYTLNRDGIKIRLDDGWSDFGGGRLTVDHAGRIVLSCDRNVGDDKKYAHHPRANYFTVLTYLPGGWELKVDELLTKPKEPPKPELPKDPEVDPKVLKNLKDNFDF